MAKIRFAAFKGISFVSKCIKFWTRSDYSHIAYILDWYGKDYIDITKLIEAWKFEDGWRWGVSGFCNHKPKTPVEIWFKEVEFEKAKKLKEIMLQFACNKVKYDWKGIIGFVFKCNDWKDKYFCSEGCAKGLVESGIWNKDLNLSVIHPDYFVQLMKVSRFEKEIEFTI